MKVGLLALALLVSTAAGAAPQSRPGGTGDAKAHFDRGIALVEKGDLDGAIGEYREVIRLKPDFADAHNNLGAALNQKGDLDEAIAESRAAIRLKPDYAIAHNNLGVALDAKGDLDGAIAEWREGLRLKPDDYRTWNNVCWDRAIKGELEAALANCNESLHLKNDKNTLDSRGFVYLKMKNPDAAIADYNAALRIDPKIASSLYGRGLAERMKGDKSASEADIAAATKLRPDVADQFTKWGVPVPRP